MNRRDSNERLDMSIIRKEPSAPGDSLQQRQERALAVDDNATGYTAQWVSSIKPPERARSCSRGSPAKPTTLCTCSKHQVKAF